MRGRARKRARTRAVGSVGKAGVADNPARGKAHGRNDRRHRTIVDDTDRTRERSPEARPISKCLERPPPQSSFPGGRSPRRKSIGAGTCERSTGRWVRTGRNASLNELRPDRCIIRLAAGFSPRVSTRAREQTCEGCNPRSAAGRKEGRTCSPGQVAEVRVCGSGTSRARNGRDE